MKAFHAPYRRNTHIMTLQVRMWKWPNATRTRKDQLVSTIKSGLIQSLLKGLLCLPEDCQAELGVSWLEGRHQNRFFGSNPFIQSLEGGDTHYWPFPVIILFKLNSWNPYGNWRSI